MQLCPLLYICKHQHLPAREQTHFQLPSEGSHGYCLCSDPYILEGTAVPMRHVFQSFHWRKCLFLPECTLPEAPALLSDAPAVLQGHNLNETDIFFFDVVVLCMRMIYAQRIFLCSNIISQRQIKLKQIISFTGNGRNGIMRFSLCFRKHKGFLICISSPYLQNMRSKIDQTFFHPYDGFEEQTAAILQFPPLHLHIPESLHFSQWGLLPWQRYNGLPGNDHGLK